MGKLGWGVLGREVWERVEGGGTDIDVEFSVALAGCGGSAEVQAEALGMATGRAARVRAERWERESSDECRMCIFMLGLL